MVVWTEAAALAFPNEEQALVAEAAATARAERIHLVAAYIVPMQLAPLRYENKF